MGIGQPIGSPYLETREGIVMPEPPDIDQLTDEIVELAHELHSLSSQPGQEIVAMEVTMDLTGKLGEYEAFLARKLRLGGESDRS